MRTSEWKRWSLGAALCALGAANACSSSSSGSDSGATEDATAEGATTETEEAGLDAGVGEAGPEGSASPPVDATLDAPVAEADASDAAPDSSPGDASAHDAGGGGDGGIVGPTLLTSGTRLSIKGITEDNYVVYFDYSSSTYYANRSTADRPS